MKKPAKVPEPPRTLGEDDKTGIRAALEGLRQSPGFKSRGAQNAMIAIAARALGASGGGAMLSTHTECPSAPETSTVERVPFCACSSCPIYAMRWQLSR